MPQAQPPKQIGTEASPVSAARAQDAFFPGNVPACERGCPLPAGWRPSAFKRQFSVQTEVLEGVCFTEYTVTMWTLSKGVRCAGQRGLWSQGLVVPCHPTPGRAPRMLQPLHFASWSLRLEHNRSFVLYNKNRCTGPEKQGEAVGVTALFPEEMLYVCPS